MPATAEKSGGVGIKISVFLKIAIG